MLQYAAPIAYAIFLWWFSTGAILFLDGLPKWTFRWSMLAATAVLAISIYELKAGNGDTTTGGAYAAFGFALLAWGWQEIGFYMGIVTGPRKELCAEGCSGWRHFGHAIMVSLYHEIGIIVTAAVVYAVVWPGTNHIGFWTYCVLWWMHQSAKLNVFLGVRNLNEEFLPEHMAFLKSFLTKKPMNLLFPVSVTVSTVVAAMLFQKALSPAVSAFELTGYLFLAAMMTLAILEHWFLILPLPFAALWNWSLKARPVRRPFDVEIVAGFLGAGKTTYVRRLLASADPSVRTIVLVNDFGSLGIDGSLLSGRGAEVIELPNGCICCSLSNDLARQLQTVIARWSPRRVIIEPSGVADVAGLLAVLGRPDVRAYVEGLRICTIIDASKFLSDYTKMHAFFEAQAALASMLIVNKIDIAPPADLPVIEATLQALNPKATILRARRGLAQAAGFDHSPQTAEWRFAGENDKSTALHGHSHGHEDALGFTSWSTRLSSSYRLQELQDLLDSVARGAYGQIERVKGIARANEGWVHFDVTGGRSSVAAFAPAKDEEQRVTAIGRTLDGIKLQAAFDACAEQGAVSC